MPKYGIDFHVDKVRDYIDKIEFGKDAIIELGSYPELSQDLNNIISAEIKTLSSLMAQYEDTTRGMDVNARNDKFKRDARTIGLRYQNVYKNLTKPEGFDIGMKIVTKNETVFVKDPNFLKDVIGEGFGSLVKFYIEDLKKISCNPVDLDLELSETLLNKIPQIQKNYYLEYSIIKVQEEKEKQQTQKEVLTFEKYVKILTGVISALDSNIEYAGKEDDRKLVSIDMQKFLSESMLAYSRFSTTINSYTRQAKEDELAEGFRKAGVKANDAKKRAHNILNDPYVDADNIEYVKANMGREYLVVVNFFGNIFEPSQMEKVLKTQDMNFSEFLKNVKR